MELIHSEVFLLLLVLGGGVSGVGMLKKLLRVDLRKQLLQLFLLPQYLLLGLNLLLSGLEVFKFGLGLRETLVP